MANIDTLKYYEELVKGGAAEIEAKAHVYALSGAVNDLATKDDLKSAIGGLESKITIQFNIIEKVGGSFCIAITMLLLKIAFWP